MGARSGGGAGMGSRSLTGLDRHGRTMTFTLKEAQDTYQRQYNEFMKEAGDVYKKQAAAASTEKLKAYPLKKDYGSKEVEKQWKNAVKMYKSGKYDVEIANFKSSWGATTMKHIAQEAVRQTLFGQN